MQSIAQINKEERTFKNYIKLLNTLHSHIEENDGKDLSKIKEILQSYDINYKISNSGNTVLHGIVEKDRWFTSSYAEFLINQGADPTIVNHNGQTVIHWIISQVDKCFQKYPPSLSTSRWISFLLNVTHIQNRNMTNFADCHKFSHFHAACMINIMEIVEFFLENGVSVDEAVSINSPYYPGYTPLHFAALFGYDELVKKLLSHKASLILKDAEGMTVLHMLIERNMKIIQFVNLHRVATGEQSEEEAACYRMRDKEKLLAEMEINEKIITSILLATDKTVIESIGLLPFYAMRKSEEATINDVNQHIKVDSTIWPGYTSLHFAARFNVEAVNTMIQKGASIEAKDAKGITPFELCVGRYTVEDIHCIISNHSNWKNIILSDDKIALLDLIFAMRNPEDFEKFLTEKDINNISIPSDSPLWAGFNILHLAVALSRKGMRLRLANYISLFHDDFKMEKAYYLRLRYPPFTEEESIRRPDKLVGVCLRLNGDVIAQDSNGSTPIHLVFRRLDLENMYFMIQCCKGDSNPTDKDNLSLLHIACAVEDVNLVKKLIASGADINAAVLPSFQWDAEVQYFHNLNSDKHLHVWPGSTPLHVAMTVENREIIKLLMEAHVDLEVEDADGFTALQLQITQYPDNDTFDEALVCKLISEDRVVDGLSYLHIAALQKYPKFMEKLLNLGVDVNAVIVARERISEDSFSYLKYLDKINNRTTKLSYFFSYYEGFTPLHMVLERCFKSRDYEIAKTLISRGADVLAKNSRGISPLSKFLSNYENLLEHYLSVMSDSEEKRLAREMQGMTKLHLACRLCDEKLIRDCLKKSTNINARIHDDSKIWPGYTPLHVLVKVYCPDLVDKITLKQHKKQVCVSMRLLLDAGADVMIVNSQGQTPLLLRIYRNHINSRPRHINMMWKKLKKNTMNPVSDEGISHFHLACIRNDVAMVKKFLKLGVDANQTVDYFSDNYAGYTPLHFAVCRKMSYWFHVSAILKTIDLLLKYGAKVNAMDVDNKTPLHLASEFKSLGAVPYNRLFWAGADTNIEQLSNGKKPNR